MSSWPPAGKTKDRLMASVEQLNGDAKARQIGGGHYKDLAIQPVDYIVGNGLDYLAGNVVKYVTRHKAKGGAEDIRKAIHYCELILAHQYED